MMIDTPHMRPRQGSERPVIRQLDETAINQIAAGEVVERPASAVKELVENAIDAGANRIVIDYADGGKSLIRVSDDGCGMVPEELNLALSRHATSKIDGSDLLNIQCFGFRGEALPSLGAVGRLKITSRAMGFDAASILLEGGRLHPVTPAALTSGTVVSLRDLFFATPARLKFMRTDRSESQAILETIRRLAMAEPYIGFTLRDLSGTGEGRIIFRADPENGDFFDALYHRLTRVVGADFSDNALRIDLENQGLRLMGYAALPTYSRGSSVAQYMFVNGRPVLDRMLFGALRAAYMDVLSRNRHPAAVLNICCDPQSVDVNVHPAKSEVRFRDPVAVRGLIVSGLRQALAQAGHRASSTVGDETCAAFQAPDFTPRPYHLERPSRQSLSYAFHMQAPTPVTLAGFEDVPSGRFENHTDSEADLSKPLGAARAQLHENYIVAQTETGMVIVDQHAAHERLVYERLKTARDTVGITAQALLIPEIVELSAQEAERLLEIAPELASLGLVIEAFGGSAIVVRETPAILGATNGAGLLHDILDDLSDLGHSERLQALMDAVLSRMACHGSVRSGRHMRAAEMNALLREMEATPNSGQCNHGRPTYVALKLTDIERLFGRR
ncbi:MAG: DNA mismatch repair protein MutL [Paracoccaceae bacterium]|jgi:DNA mismatch repair protein MutL